MKFSTKMTRFKLSALCLLYLVWKSCTRNKKAIAATFVMLCLTGLAFADTVSFSLSKYWGHQEVIVAEGGCITRGASTDVCQLFPAGTGHTDRIVNTVSGLGTVYCCWVGNTGLTLTGTDIIDAGGPNGTGTGSCHVLMTTASTFEDLPDRADLVARLTPGMRNGLCSLAALFNDEQNAIFAPCTVGSGTAECVDFGGGTCVTAASAPTTWANQIANAGLFMFCSGNPDTNVAVVKLRPKT